MFVFTLRDDIPAGHLVAITIGDRTSVYLRRSLTEVELARALTDWATYMLNRHWRPETS
jgi:hypothetical protein